MKGRTLGHFRVTDELGSGGMGEVWRAQDTKLGREVALKVLSEEFADDADRLERFEREARAVATLNHPHIVTIFSVEEADGIRFLTMELIEGRSLDKLIPDGGLDLASFLELATPLAEAISAAHDKSVIHRDLKPSNVMVDGENRVKVLDFGLAKVGGSEGVSDSSELPTEALTGVGVLVGTVPYMSPEQIEGLIVDHRSDIFSLGVLLYEMATGNRPFAGDSQPALMSSILRDVPQSVVEIRNDVPRHLGRLIGRCLEKDRRDRYQTARDVFNELKALRRESSSSMAPAGFAAGGVPANGLPPSPTATIRTDVSEEIQTTEKSIAVLPFVNMSANQEDEYFSDGLSEEIINALIRIPDLRVIARTSAFRFRGEQDLRAVGEALGVRNVLEGSVRRAGEQLRITAQLIDVADDSHIWSERFDREMTDVFEIQDEIAEAIVNKLHVSFGSSAPTRRQTENVVAYEALLESRYYFFQFTPKAAERALACLRRSLSLEPDYPDALVEHGFYHLMMAYMFSDPRDELPHVRALASKALQRDPDHGEAHAAVAVMATFLDRDWSASENSFRRALELSPASARVHELYGLCCLLGKGRFDESLAELDRAIELDPLSALYAGNRGRVLTCSRQFAEAEESCRRGLALDPGQLLAQVELIYALLFQDKFDEAIAIGRRAIETHGPVNAPRQALALSYAIAGRRDEAFELVSETAEPGTGYRSPLARGLVHAAFSEMDEAFDCVERSLDELDPLFAYLAVHPMFDNLRADPRYPNLLERMNLSEGDST